MSKPFLEAGHEFRDLDGTLVATLARNVNHYDPIYAEDFVFEEGFKQKALDVIHPAITRVIKPWSISGSVLGGFKIKELS